MRTLREFIRQLDGQPEQAPDIESGDVVTARVLGFDVAAVLLPSEVLLEDRVSRMNEFWDTIADRDVLVVALIAKWGRRSRRLKDIETVTSFFPSPTSATKSARSRLKIAAR